jgi:hypothetical protein
MQNFKEFAEAAEKQESIAIEVLGMDSQWRRVGGGIFNRPQSIAQALDSTKKRYPKNRVRAVGQDTGKFYDMLP